ncbi:MAG TPA: amidohydrolase family protein [Candidatus Baltobacteraceae bacterium]|nr:amidohydrolase family protein [Candidatus Baltobacteraceae bacterium]
MRLLIAGWVFPISQPPIPDGAIAIEAGAIVAVGARTELRRRFPQAQRTEFPDAALLPGLINCHTHLELPVDPDHGPEPFVPWVVRLIARRRGADPDTATQTADAGVQALLRSGTTTVADVSTTGCSAEPIRRAALRAMVFREVLGVQASQAAERIGAAAEAIRKLQDATRGSRVTIGISPHSPYGLSEPLLDACRRLVVDNALPTTIHAAESPAEVAYVRDGTGPIPDILYPAVGCPEPLPRRSARSPIAYLDSFGLLERALVVHAVHVDEADGRLLAARGARVVHCPRSNRRLSEGEAPVAMLQAHGIPVGLGTDSLASSASLDLWDEMRAVDLPAAQALALATLGGARALGWDRQIGSITPGKRADLIAVSADALRGSHPEVGLLECTRNVEMLWSMVEGGLVFAQPGVAACA